MKHLLVSSCIAPLFALLPVSAAEVPIAPHGVPASAAFSYPRSHALVIANSKYLKGWAPLPATIEEAQQVARALLAQGFELHGGGVHCDLTGAQLKTLMDAFFLTHGRGTGSTGDRLVVFYGGHGATVQGTAQRGYILGIDAPTPSGQGKLPGAPLKFADLDAERAFSTATVSMTEVRKQAEDADARHVLFVFDSCFAGQVFRSRAAGDDPSLISPSTKAPVREFFTSGGAAEEVPGKSVFVPYLVRGLKGQADKNHDGVITSGELAAYVAAQVKESETPTTVTLGPLPRPEFNEGQTVFLPREPLPETALVKLLRPGADVLAMPEEDDRARLLAGTKNAPFVNTLGMKFVPVAGTKVLFSVWDTRVQDYAVFAKESGREWKKPEFDQGPTHPAVNVSWEDAKVFCDWLSKKEGREYRLPTDAEWSVAVGLGAEAGSTPAEKDGKLRGYPWGEQFPPPKGAGNYADETAKKAKSGEYCINGYDDGYAYTSPVGSFRENQYGLYDMGGNVLQWCEDLFDQMDTDRVLRGSSWYNDASVHLRSSSRACGGPASRGRGDINGFRLVVSVP